MNLNYKICDYFDGFQEGKLAGIVTLEEQSFENPWDLQSLQTVLASPFNFVLSAEDKKTGICIAYSLIRKIDSEVELLRFAVNPQLRQSRVGTNLLDALLKNLSAFPVEKIYLEVSEKNRPAIDLYHKAGFLTVARRPGYYDNGKTDALMLELRM